MCQEPARLSRLRAQDGRHHESHIRQAAQADRGATGAGDSAGLSGRSYGAAGMLGGEKAEDVGRTSPTEESGTSPCYGEAGSRHQCPKRAHQGHTPGTVLTGPQANEATDLPSGESARQLTSCP